MSTPKRFFIQNIHYPPQTEALLSGDEFIHAKTVLRLAEGDEITLLDGTGMEYDAIVAKMEKNSLTAHIRGVMQGNKEPQTLVYLLVGALKGDKTELVVQKATELGVHKIGVFASRYCAAYMNENKIERLNKVAHEAAKQCLRSIAPTVTYFNNFDEALASCKDYPNKLFACEFATSSDVNMRSLSGNTALIVGSEGGFADEEFDTARTRYGFSGITLGKRILRAETAAITLTSIVMYALGELE